MSQIKSGDKDIKKNHNSIPCIQEVEETLSIANRDIKDIKRHIEL